MWLVRYASARCHDHSVGHGSRSGSQVAVRRSSWSRERRARAAPEPPVRAVAEWAQATLYSTALRRRVRSPDHPGGTSPCIARPAVALTAAAGVSSPELSTRCRNASWRARCRPPLAAASRRVGNDSRCRSRAPFDGFTPDERQRGSRSQIAAHRSSPGFQSGADPRASRRDHASGRDRKTTARRRKATGIPRPRSRRSRFGEAYHDRRGARSNHDIDSASCSVDLARQTSVG